MIHVEGYLALSLEKIYMGVESANGRLNDGNS